MRLEAAGMAVDLPPGWEGEVARGGDISPQGVSRRPRVAHFSNFPLPAERADFGAEAVVVMRPGDVFVALFEYGPESADRPLFSTRGIPLIHPRDFDRNALQHGLPGQSGLQRFFNIDGRPFCLYVVVGSHIDRADVVDEVNLLLASVTLS
ncbi:MAG: hypothetical protein ACLFWM_14830 [Actinomycetota bacterium]